MLEPRIAVALLATLLGGCVVGPSYRGPPAVVPTPTHFERADASATSGNAAPVARWWIALNDAQLNRLMDQALAGSPDVLAARARLREARATLGERRADALPKTGTSAAYLRSSNFTSLLGGGGGGGALDLYSLNFDATWEVDLFGARRRAVEGAAAALQGSDASLADVQVTLTAEVAEAYIELRDAQQRVALTQRNLEIEERIVKLYDIRRGGGIASDLDLERVSNQVDATRATLAPLRGQVAQQLDRLALLTAHAPGALDSELGAVSTAPAPPAQVEIGDPAALLQRRPDIVVAERRLAQRTAAIGQAEAAQFPKVQLLGDVGFNSLTPASLLNSANLLYILAPVLQWTPLDFGRNHARIAQASARRDEAEADYRQAVLSALEDAESSLARYGEARNAVADLTRARGSAERVYSMTEIRLRGGTATTTDVLDADTRRVQAELSYQRGLAELTEDYVALQKSLGLGWVTAAGTRSDAPEYSLSSIEGN